MKVSRRRFSRYILGAPIAAAASTVALETLLGDGGVSGGEPKPTPMSQFLARQEPELSRQERRRVQKDVTQLEARLKEIRDFRLGNDVPPAGIFRAMKSKRS